MSDFFGKRGKIIIFLTSLLALGLVTAACGRDSGEENTGEISESGAGEKTESGNKNTADGIAGNSEDPAGGPGSFGNIGNRPEDGVRESIAVKNVNESASPYFGIMHITVLDVSGKAGESGAVYAFTENSDPENAWSVTGLELSDIETDLSVGAKAVILYHGDVINDSENIEFIAALPEGDYTIKAASGETVSNTMSSFTLRTDSGEEINFIKDNCHIEEGAMSSDSGDDVVVYYADGGELGRYPMSVYGKAR